MNPVGGVRRPALSVLFRDSPGVARRWGKGDDMNLLKSLAVAAVALALPSMASAAVIYDLTLTDAFHPPYSGTGTIPLSSAPSMSGQTNYASAAVTFLIDGQSFSGTATAVQF